MNMKDKALTLWNYLAVTRCPDKGTAYKMLKFEPDFNDCPMCELATVTPVEEEPDFKEINCKICPLYGRWHGKDRNDYETCTSHGDTFVRNWHVTQSRTQRQVYAKAVHYNILKEWEIELDD